jgi:hypothetical protein
MKKYKFTLIKNGITEYMQLPAYSIKQLKAYIKKTIWL